MAGPQNAAFPAGIYSQSPLQQQLAALSTPISAPTIGKPINPPSMTAGPPRALNPAQNPSFLAALSAVAAPPAPPAPTLQQVMQEWAQQVAGAAPTAVTPQSFGAAPTLGQYWDPSSYDAASGAVGKANTTSQGSINDAYGQAMQQLLSEGGKGAAEAAAGVQQAQSQAATAGSQEHQAIQTALQGAAPGGLLSNQLGAQQATLDANNQRGVTTAQALQGLTNSNNSNFQQGLSSSKANALQFLASQVQGELSKIGMAKASAQTSSERAYQAALDGWNTNTNNANIAASNANAKNSATYSTSLQDAMKQATAASNSQATTGRQQVLDQLNGGQLSGALGQALSNVIHGNKNNGTAAPASLPDALAAIQANSGTLKQQGVDPNQLANLVKQYWSNTKVAPTPQALQAYLQGYS